MRIEAKFICPEIVGPLRSGAYEVPEGAAISDLLAISRAEHYGQAPECGKDFLLFLRNGKPAQVDTKIAPGDKIHILREVFGG